MEAELLRIGFSYADAKAMADDFIEELATIEADESGDDGIEPEIVAEFPTRSDAQIERVF
tara:strand:- start:445 stop:624 length:180 start_codon:yes stop_codon:yes gene_type:complete